MIIVGGSWCCKVGTYVVKYAACAVGAGVYFSPTISNMER